MHRTYRWLPGILLSLVLLAGHGCSTSRENTQADGTGTDPATETTPDAKENSEVAPESGQPAGVQIGGVELTLPEPAGQTMDATHARKAGQMINQGLGYLLSQQNDDGTWSLDQGAMKPAITALVLKALVQHPDLTMENPVVQRGFQALLKYQQEDGSIYDPQQGRSNYNTAIAVMALAAANDPQFQEPMARAVEYLLSLQIVPGSETPDGAELDREHPYIGGVSYGSHGRPDLSNVGMWVQALHDAGVEGEDPAMQRALRFVTRTQNLSETNPMEWAQEGTNDGGFIYAPAKKDASVAESKAGRRTGGRGLRSYGSMTYVGFKSLLYAGLRRDDPRVKAAYAWIRRYWRLDSNPNMPDQQSHQGLYYYYHAFAKALRAWGEPVIVDPDGKEHNWREELTSALAERVREDGSWINEKASRWAEGNPVLTTGYSVLALQEAMKK